MNILLTPLKTMDFVLKMMDFVLKMMDFVLKMMDFGAAATGTATCRDRFENISIVSTRLKLFGKNESI